MSRLDIPQDNMSEKEKMRLWRDEVSRQVFASFTWNPPNVAALSAVSTTLTSATVPELEGLREGMAVRVTPPSDLDDGLGDITAWVPDDNQLTIRLRNFTALDINQGSGTWVFRAYRT